jgi:hypothetical protein
MQGCQALGFPASVEAIRRMDKDQPEFLAEWGMRDFG